MCLTLALLLVAGVAAAVERTDPAISDVALQANGVLTGQVVNTAGIAQAKSQVVVVKNGKVLAATMTDANGEFAVAGVNPGVYQIEAPHSGGVYRVWASRTAPPAAKNGVFMISDSRVVRANGDGTYGPAIRGAIAGGLLTGGLIAILDNNPAGS
ncbi:MAG: carboxypeptidase regulatory-like domain-containing protein [Planctomycetia bacterium]|nr:carboxypeptidase regulatory-like domain-containing protein [Planctomycetia bacterium]